MTAPALKRASNVMEGWVERYRDDPNLFAYEVVGEPPDEWQTEGFGACTHPDENGVCRVSVRSAHRVGKTWWLSVLHWWWLTCRGDDAKVMVTAATAPQLFDALVPEIKKMYARLPRPIQELFTVQAEGVYHVAAPDAIFSSFRTSKAEAPESAAGIHADHVCYLCDEASGIPDSVFEAQIGSFADPDVLYVLAGNPVRLTGFFYETHTNPELAEQWNLFHVSAFDTERVGRALIDEARWRYGEDSNAYRVRVLGEFPLADDDAVFPFDLVQAALDRDVKAHEVRPIWGLDCARYGRDRSALAKRQGNALLEPVRSWQGLDTMQLTGAVMNEWESTNPLGNHRPEEIEVDSIGLGSGVADRLRELGLPARDINVSEAPAMGARYANLKAELHFLGREWFETQAVALGGRDVDGTLWRDEDLARELATVDYKFTSSGRIQIVPKNSKGERTLRSPDLADAFILTFAGRAISAMHGSKQGPSWKQPLRRSIRGIV